ncbi:MAG: hypothetical protein R3F61_18225 [Myxococcota bacterium]
MNRFLLALLLLPIGCKGENVVDADGDADTDADADSDADSDTDTDTLVMSPNAFGVGVAEFAIDADGNAASFTAFDQAGTPVQGQVALSVLILDESATTSINDFNSCQITFGAPGPIAPSTTWATAAGVYWGFELPPGSTVVGDTCQNFEFPDEWEDDVAGKVGQWSWGFALNVMDPTVQSQLAAGFGAQWAAIEDGVVGGGWYSNLISQAGGDPNGYIDGGYAIGTQMDGTNTIVVDGAGNPVLLDADTEVWIGGPLPGPGIYSGSGVQYLTPASLLLGTPQ